MEKLKLVGTLNCFNIRPHFVLPVYEDDKGNFYMAYSDVSDEEEKYTIKGFTIFGKYDTKRIKLLSNTNNKMEETEDYYGIGDIIVQAFEESENNIYIGRIDKFTKYLSDFVNTLDDEETKKFFGEYVEDYNLIIKDMNQKVIKKQTKKIGNK